MLLLSEFVIILVLSKSWFNLFIKHDIRWHHRDGAIWYLLVPLMGEWIWESVPKLLHPNLWNLAYVICTIVGPLSLIVGIMQIVGFGNTTIGKKLGFTIIEK